MHIIEFNNLYENQAKDLLVELQQYIIKIDKYKLNILSKDYRDEYFANTYKQVYSNNGKNLLAVENNYAIGMITAFERLYDKSDYLDYLCPKCGIISELIITKNCQSKAVGSLILKTAEKYLNSNKCECIKIEVFSYNDLANKFY